MVHFVILQQQQQLGSWYNNSGKVVHTHTTHASISPSSTILVAVNGNEAVWLRMKQCRVGLASHWPWFAVRGTPIYGIKVLVRQTSTSVHGLQQYSILYVNNDSTIEDAYCITSQSIKLEYAPPRVDTLNYALQQFCSWWGVELGQFAHRISAKLNLRASVASVCRCVIVTWQHA